MVMSFISTWLELSSSRLSEESTIAGFQLTVAPSMSLSSISAVRVGVVVVIVSPAPATLGQPPSERFQFGVNQEGEKLAVEKEKTWSE